MTIAVTGSIATDHLMTFPGRFTDSLVADRLDRISLSFLVDDLVVRRGGCAPNICFGLAALGLHPLLVGAAGHDFDDYRAWLDRSGVDTRGVHVATDLHTARFLCTTDQDMNQLASFYPGAMSRARLVELAPLADLAGPLDLVVVAPNDPEAMRRHTQECRERGYPFVADPSQQLARLDGDQIVQLVDGATYLLTNDYEAGLLLGKTGWSADEVLGRVGVWVVTKGEKGCTVSRRGLPDIDVPAVPEVSRADPTGVGDAFRAGFLAGVSWGVGIERAAQVASLLATYVLETVGTQEYDLCLDAETGTGRQPRGATGSSFLGRLAEAFGPDAAADIAPHLPARAGLSRPEPA